MNHKVIHSPIQSPTLALDIGCGTGIITDLLGSKFPKAEVYGLDLSPVPELHTHPSNVKFLQGNALTQQPHDWAPADSLSKEGGFDLIFSRLLVCGMSDWPAFIRTEFNLLKSGGWAEIHDVDWVWFNTSGENISDRWPWWCRVRDAGHELGLDFECASHAAERMREAGFVDVQVSKYRWPFGGQWESSPEMREMGEYSASAMPELTWHMIERLMKGKGAGDEDIADMRGQMKKDFAPEEGKHWDFYVTVGRKP